MLARSIILAAVLSALPAAAQADSPRNGGPSTVDPKACAQNGPQDPRSGESRPPATSGQGNSASEKLSRSEGVICPPDVDPEIKAPTPDAGKTPVIPPPGSPGGDPNVRPK
jgi:hypothetical protein